MRQLRHARAGRILLRGALPPLLLLFACGRGESPASSGASMAVPTASEANRPPEILQIGFSPAQPEPGGEVTALVRASDPDGDPVQLSYRWEVGGDRIGASGATIPMPKLQKGHLYFLAPTFVQ